MLANWFHKPHCTYYILKYSHRREFKRTTHTQYSLKNYFAKWIDSVFGYIQEAYKREYVTFVHIDLYSHTSTHTGLLLHMLETV